MPIAIPPRKGLRAKRLLEENPELSPSEVAKLVGTHSSNIAKALRREQFGSDVPKSRRRPGGERP